MRRRRKESTATITMDEVSMWIALASRLDPAKYPHVPDAQAAILRAKSLVVDPPAYIVLEGD